MSYSRAEEIAQANREYHPCRNGIHVCGVTPDEERPLTVANVPGVSRERFEALKAEFGIPHEDSDLVVDFNVRGDTVDDFSIRRQMLDAVLRAVSK